MRSSDFKSSFKYLWIKSAQAETSTSIFNLAQLGFNQRRKSKVIIGYQRIYWKLKIPLVGIHKFDNGCA